MVSASTDQELRASREALLQEHLTAERSGDPKAIIATFRDPRYELVGAGRVYNGEAEVGTYLRERHKVFPDLQTEVISLWHTDNQIVAELWLSGTHRGEFGDIAASGRRFRCRTACFFEFDGRDLIGVRAYFDTGTIARQLA